MNNSVKNYKIEKVQLKVKVQTRQGKNHPIHFYFQRFSDKFIYNAFHSEAPHTVHTYIHNYTVMRVTTTSKQTTLCVTLFIVVCMLFALCSTPHTSHYLALNLRRDAQTLRRDRNEGFKEGLA